MKQNPPRILVSRAKKSENVHHRAEEVDEESSTKETICHRDSNSMSEADDESIVREPKEGQQLDPVMEESPLSPNKESKIKPDILWPVTKNNYISTSGCPDGVECCSPLRPKHSEILTTRVCVELGVLKNGDLCHNMLPDGSPSTVVICSVDVEPCPGHIVELNEVKFTTNAMGSLCSESIAQKVADPILTGASSVETNGNKTDVLDRISQDLGYLLNQSPSPPAKARRNLKIARNNSVNTAEKSKM